MARPPRATIRPTIIPPAWLAMPLRCSPISASARRIYSAIRWERAFPLSWRWRAAIGRHSLIFGGLGIGIVDGVGDWESIADALLAEDPNLTTRRGGPHVPRASPTRPRAIARRLRHASRPRARFCRSRCVAHHAADAGRARHEGRDRRIGRTALARLMPNAVAFAIEGRDHMLCGRRPQLQEAGGRVPWGASASAMIKRRRI